MSGQESLFSDLAATAAAGHRLGQAPVPVPLVASTVETLEVWAEHGIPADMSTVEHACNVLMGLWRERATWLAMVDDLLDTIEAGS